MKEVIVEGWDLHPKQAAIFADIVNGYDTAYTLAIGRQFGKTVTLAQLCIWALCEGKSVAYIAAFWSQTKVPFNHLRRLLSQRPDLFRMTASPGNTHIECVPTGGSIDFFSAERPDSIRGNTYNVVLLDEAGLMRDEIEAVTMPLLAVKGEKLVIAGTPKGRSNYFARMFERGTLGEDGKAKVPGYKSYRFPSYDSPYVKRAYIENMRAELPVELFEQEINARFLDAAGAVFGNIAEAFQAVHFAEPSGPLFAGVDIANEVDYTVLTILDINGSCVYFGRWNKCGYDETVKRIADTINQYKDVHVLMERNGPGREVAHGVYERTEHSIDLFTTTNESKSKAIRYLRTRLERTRLNFPAKLCGQLRSELADFTYKLTPSGKTVYGASPGGHDDCVMSLALACWLLKQYHNE